MTATYFVDARGALVLVDHSAKAAHVFEGGSWHRDDRRAMKPLSAAQAERAFPEAFGEEPAPTQKR